jgi:hypothetical protein
VVTSGLTFLILILNDKGVIPDAYARDTRYLELEKGPATLALSDFMSPDLNLYNSEPRYYLFRKRLARWDKVQMQPYWVEPKDIILDLLAKKNETLMNNLLEKIP